jgi:hypothetical protein
MKSTVRLLVLSIDYFFIMCVRFATIYIIYNQEGLYREFKRKENKYILPKK